MTITSACPKCRASGNDKKGNNLHEYPNNYHCFACGYNHRKVDLNYIASKLQPTSPVLGSNSLITSSYIPAIALKWLLKYRLTKEEMQGFSWCESKQLLVLYQDDHYWQGRCFAKEAKTKYMSYGLKPVILYGSNKDSFVYVEDIISAIKVSRVATSCPMLGGIPLKSTESYAKTFKNVFLWNDLDLLRTSIKTARNISERIGKQVKVIVSELDPKEYNETEIYNYIKELK